MRAREPDHADHVVRDGVRLYHEVFGDDHPPGTPTILLMPSWSIVHSRLWKLQVPDLARHYRVVVFDGRGNGRSDRPRGAEAYRTGEFVGDALAVLDATGTDAAVLVGLSFGAHCAAILASRHPDRVRGACLIAPAAPIGPRDERRSRAHFEAQLNSDTGWNRYNRHSWQRDYRGFAEFFFAEALSEPHSTKPHEDCVAWALETTPEVLIDTVLARYLTEDEGAEAYARITCPVLVVHGRDDRIVPYATGEAVAAAANAPLVTLEGTGHLPTVRDPVPMNRLIRDFADRVTGRLETARMTVRAHARRPQRVLYLSSPIGLGHARRDLAIARELRRLKPGMEIDWLTQHPVTALLETAGERLHPASARLANESRHIEEEAGEHDLHVFEALRRMDEILVANFMLFQEVVEDGRYDLVVADEAWDVDHFWHENPELKRAPLAWLTDFVGYLPMAEGGAREAAIAADYNAEMIGHVERLPQVRDRAIFVGEPDDIVAARFGAELQEIRDWTCRHYDFCGYITGRAPDEFGPRAELRERLGYAADEKVCIASVGGSAVGAHLLKRIIAAAPLIRERVPGLRLVAVAGPRLDPAALPQAAGVELRGYVPDLDAHFAACDVALVQGGLTTCMELTAARVPFVYFPLRNHFEQRYHVHHRLQRYGAGVAMDYDAADPERIADAVSRLLTRPVASRPVEPGGAARAARLLAELC